jgi:hypothetical protein
MTLDELDPENPEHLDHMRMRLTLLLLFGQPDGPQEEEINRLYDWAVGILTGSAALELMWRGLALPRYVNGELAFADPGRVLNKQKQQWLAASLAELDKDGPSA